MLAAIPTTIIVEELSLGMASQLAVGCTSCVGHADTAAIFSEVLGVPVPVARASITLEKGKEALVGQYSGPRLPEGSTTLPEGATIKWLKVTVK